MAELEPHLASLSLADGKAYPWLQVNSTLQACFKEDTDVAADTSDTFAKEAPKVMQTFLAHGEACDNIDKVVLQLARGDISDLFQLGPSPIEVFQETMEKLYDLFFQANDLQASIEKLTSDSTPEPVILSATELKSTTVPARDNPVTPEVANEAPVAQASAEAPTDNASAVPDTTAEPAVHADAEESITAPSNDTSPTSVKAVTGGNEGDTNIVPPAPDVTDTSATSLTPAPNPGLATDAAARAELIPVFSACIPIIHARMANLKMALEIVDGAKENLALTLHLEDLENNPDGYDYSDDDSD